MIKKIGSDYALISLLTILVSFCSIIYELVYSQALTVLYGGTVARYSITIGLYLISLGFGAFFYNVFKFKNKAVFFWVVELLLSLAGPFGVLAIFALSSASLAAGWVNPAPVFFISHVPILLVGVLSGIEIPLLVGLLSADEKDKFSKILGLDYLGAFIGTVVYSLVLYPKLGLIATALWVGFLNFLSMGIYTVWKMGKNAGLKLVSLFILILYLLLLYFSNDIQSNLQRTYRESEIRFQYRQDPEVRSVRVEQTFSTPYQDVTLYETVSPQGETDTCLSLDSHTQICDSTYQLYHGGLVDVPMLFLRGEKLKALVIGGGDFIAVDFLLQYPNVESIDQVDIDGQFLEFMKTNPHFKELHHDAYKSPLLKIFVEDGYSYLRFNQKKYDFILIDLPGVQHDKLSHLFSAEFYGFLYRSLTDQGVVSGWTYGALSRARKHYETLMNTMREGGFRTHVLYDAYRLKDDHALPAQPFYLLSKGNDREPLLPSNAPESLQRSYSLYRGLTWIEIPEFSDVRPNTVLKPNYDIVLKA